MVNEDEVANLRDQFHAIDKDGTGMIHASELTEVLKNKGTTLGEDEVNKIIEDTVQDFIMVWEARIAKLTSDADEMKAQKKEMEDIVQPIIAKLYQVKIIKISGSKLIFFLDIL